MSIGTITGVAVKGIACAVPDNTVYTEDYFEHFGEEKVKKFIKMTGVKSRNVVTPGQTTSDLCYVAAKKLLYELAWESESIDAIIFISQTPDYKLPATACILQHKLGLSQSCIAFDVNLGCSGYVYGLWLGSTVIKGSNINRVLIMAGDTDTFTSKQDRSTAMLFGACGSVTALEKNPGDVIRYILKTNGEGYKNLIIPAGAERNRHIKSYEPYQQKDGVFRSDVDLFMDGTEIFNFTISEVPQLIEELINSFAIDVQDVDAFILHQANLFILKHLARKLNIPLDKVPISIDTFGNTSSASIPLTIVNKLQKKVTGEKMNVICSGFGVGLSWAAIALNLDHIVCPEIIFTDYYSEDEVLSL